MTAARAARMSGWPGSEISGAPASLTRASFAGRQFLQNFRAHTGGIVFMIGAPLRVDGIKRGQLACHARVFAINNIDAVQHIERAQCDVACIAERGGNDIKARCERRAGWG